MRLLYFARVREAVGIESEERDLPAAMTISALLDLMAAEGAAYAGAFADRSNLRFALDQQMVRVDAVIGTAGELAIFPPVTGG